MKKLKANIPSKKEYSVNENGEIFSPFGKILLGKANPNSKTLRSIDFMNLDGKRQAMSIPKIVWNTFRAEDPINKKEIIVLKNPKAKFPFAVKNLEKISRIETVKKMNTIRLGK